jgi:hypothetical protein
MSGGHEGAVWTRGLLWLEGHRDGFTLPSGAEPELFRLKALGELAAIVSVLWRRPDLPAQLRGRLHALLLFAWQQLEHGEVLACYLERRAYPVLGTTYAVFERLGWRHERTRERLAEMGRPGGLSTARAPAARDATEPVAAQYGTDGVAVLCLGLALSWEALGLPSPWQRARLFPHTRLARRPAAAALTVPDAYSLTHTVFFMTDWGAQPHGLPAAERAYVAEWGPRWMDAFRLQRHFDLYAELAAVLCCVEAPVPPEAESVLASAQEADGGVPGPADRIAERTRGIEDPDRRRFVSRYHTTLAAMLASFALDAGLARGSEIVSAAAFA